MTTDFNDVHKDMIELGLGALTHANRHSAYQDVNNDKWAELSVLQAAHAAEIFIKARIAKEHPLLIFDTLPKLQEHEELTLEKLINEGRTVEWNQLPNRLQAITGITLPQKETFNRFGKLRNSIQHFGAVISNVSPALETLIFIYSVIDPFINECWGLHAIDYDEDECQYEYLLPVLVNYEIKFLVSPEAAKCHEQWDRDLEATSIEYRNEMKNRIQEALK